MQALLGFTSEARWLRHAGRHLRHLFPYLPGRSGYNKRLRRAAALIRHTIRAVACDTALWGDDVWVVDSTPVECGRSRQTAKRSALAGWAEYGCCLSTLGQLLARPGFGVGPATLGAELELFLVDGAARPLHHNQAVRAAAADARVNLELDRFNLKLNTTPTPLAGRPFATLGEELQLLLGRVAEGARAHGGRPVLVGILQARVSTLHVRAPPLGRPRRHASLLG